MRILPAQGTLTIGREKRGSETARSLRGGPPSAANDIAAVGGLHDHGNGPGRRLYILVCRGLSEGGRDHLRDADRRLLAEEFAQWFRKIFLMVVAERAQG